MIIDTSYFQNKSVFIPNVIATPSIGGNNPTAMESLQKEVDYYEEKLLIGALGNEQYIELSSQFVPGTGAQVLRPDALSKWVDLVNGYEYDGKKWKGLRYEIGTKKVSLIAYYVYFYFLKGGFSVYSTNGIQIPLSENSAGQSPNPKLSEYL